MNRDILIVIDMQNDFINGALGTEEAQAISAAVVKKVQEFNGEIFFTRDTHNSEYLNTQEGKLLPVPHCIKGSDGWELAAPLKQIQEEKGFPVYDKHTFGCEALAADLKAMHRESPITSVELIGVCTDICVVSNALLIKAALTEVPVYVDSSCCAGVTPQKHEAALETMRSCQVYVK